MYVFILKAVLFLSVQRKGGPKRRKSCSNGVATKRENHAIFGAPNLIARIYILTLTEYLRLFTQIRGLS